MNPSPFEISKGIGNQFGRAIKENRESSALDEVLTRAMNAKTPEEANQIIAQIISSVKPERQGPALKVVDNRMKQLAKDQAGGLTANQELTQIRLDASDERASALAPFKNAFGGLALANETKREELNTKLEKIRTKLEKRRKDISKRLNIKSFGDLEIESDIDEEVQGFLDELEGPKVLTNEIAADIFKEAGKDGLRGAARKAKAKELAKLRGY